MILTVPTQSTREVITLVRCDDPGPIAARTRHKRGGLFKCSLRFGFTIWAYGDEISVKSERVA